MEVKINDKLYNLLIKLQKDRSMGSIACTASPIYLVQSRYEVFETTNKNVQTFQILHIEDENYVGEEPEYQYFTIKQIKDEYLRDTYLPCNCVMALEECENLEECIEILDDYNISSNIVDGYYEYKTEAYFLSYQEAEEYLKYQGHNLSNPRIYEDYIGYKNGGSLATLIDLLDKGELFG